MGRGGSYFKISHLPRLLDLQVTVGVDQCIGNKIKKMQRTGEREKERLREAAVLGRDSRDGGGQRGIVGSNGSGRILRNSKQEAFDV